MMVSELFVYANPRVGRKSSAPIEDDAIVTARGVEWLHPTPRRLLVIK
jgi:hypothetical protein